MGRKLLRGRLGRARVPRSMRVRSGCAPLTGRAWPAPASLAATLLALDEVDDQRNSLQPIALTHAILDEVGVVARDALTRVDLDREARRTLPRLRHVDQLEAVVLLRRRLADLLDLGEEAVELRGRDAPARAVRERHRLDQQPLHVAAGLRARGQDARAQAQLLRDAGALMVEVDLGLVLAAGHVPLVEDERGRAA